MAVIMKRSWVVMAERSKCHICQKFVQWKENDWMNYTYTLPAGGKNLSWLIRETRESLTFCFPEQDFECILFHHAVADCAVVGQEDALKGHVPFALCVLREDIKTEEGKILEEIIESVRNNIGPVAAFQKGVFVKQLPKTRSGKIPRSALSALVSGKPYKITPTIEDASVFKHIEDVLKKKSVG